MKRAEFCKVETFRITFDTVLFNEFSPSPTII